MLIQTGLKLLFSSIKKIGLIETIDIKLNDEQIKKFKDNVPIFISTDKEIIIVSNNKNEIERDRILGRTE